MAGWMDYSTGCWQALVRNMHEWTVLAARAHARSTHAMRLAIDNTQSEAAGAREGPCHANSHAPYVSSLDRLGPQARPRWISSWLPQSETHRWRRSPRASRDTARGSPVDTSAAARRQLRRSGAHVTRWLGRAHVRLAGWEKGSARIWSGQGHSRACTAAGTPSRSRKRISTTVDGQRAQLAAVLFAI